MRLAPGTVPWAARPAWAGVAVVSPRAAPPAPPAVEGLPRSGAVAPVERSRPRDRLAVPSAARPAAPPRPRDLSVDRAAVRRAAAAPPLAVRSVAGLVGRRVFPPSSRWIGGRTSPTIR